MQLPRVNLDAEFAHPCPDDSCGDEIFIAPSIADGLPAKEWEIRFKAGSQAMGVSKQCDVGPTIHFDTGGLKSY